MFKDGEMILGRPLRWAMVGGGRGSKIGYIHRSAALRDNTFELVAGVFNRNLEVGKDFGKNLGVDPDRCYPDYETMFSEEAKLEDGIEVISIVTPNNIHYEIAKAALEAGLHVVCEKPLCFTTKEAVELKKTAEKNKKIIGVTYGYTGAQMVHQARKMIENGDLGEIRIINTQFAHGFQSGEDEATDPSIKWRVSPEISGSSYIIGDVGTHAYYLAELMIPKLKIKNLMCTRQSFVRSRAPLEDNAFVLINFENGAVGNLWASAVNAGSMHDHRIRVIGSKASIEWWDEHPNQLRYEIQGKPAQILERGMDYLYDDDTISCNRIGAGHAEGLFESWSNLYLRFASVMKAMDIGDLEFISKTWYPDIDAGIEGVRLVELCVKSADNGAIWVDYE